MRIFQLQRYTAVALLVFLTLHIVVVHYPPGHIDFDRVLERLDQPLWKGIDIAFLAAVLVHGLLGGYMVVTDVERYATHQRGVAGVLMVVGVVAFIYGAITIMNFTPPS